MKALILCLGMVSVTGSAFASDEYGPPVPEQHGSAHDDNSQIDQTLLNGMRAEDSQSPENYCTQKVQSLLDDVCRVSATLEIGGVEAEKSVFARLHDGSTIYGGWRAVKGAAATITTLGDETHGYARCEPKAAEKLCHSHENKRSPLSLKKELIDIAKGLEAAHGTPSASKISVSNALNRLDNAIKETLGEKVKDGQGGEKYVNGDATLKRVIKKQECRSAKNGVLGRLNKFNDSSYIPDECK